VEINGADADPVVRANTISGHKEAGVYIHRGGRATIEDSGIANNALGGMEIRTGGERLWRSGSHWQG